VRIEARCHKGELNGRRQHADDAIWRRVETDGFTYDIGSAAKTSVPQEIGNHDYQLARRLAVFIHEGESELWSYAQQLEEIWGYAANGHLQRLTTTGEVESVIGEGCNSGK
jgi:hypothetical protein